MMCEERTAVSFFGVAVFFFVWWDESVVDGMNRTPGMWQRYGQGSVGGYC